MTGSNAVTAADFHAKEARQWADAADREEVEASSQGVETAGGEVAARDRVVRYSAISTAHGLAAIATVLANGTVDVSADANVRGM